MTFDLEKARAALEEAIDRMSLAVRDEDGDVWEADPEQAEILQAILDRTEIAENHRCLELQYQLDSAEAEIERLRGEMENYGDDYVCQMNSKDVRIQELEDALVEERARALWFEGDDPCDPPNLDWKTEPNDIPESVRLLWGESARRQLQAEGKIGPDADAKPREGLYGKYRISKADGSPVDPEADYFVLRLDTDPVARRAAREYSYMTVDRKLALELQERITRYNPKMMDCINLQFFGVEKPRVWQITEERKAAIWHAVAVLKENDPDDEHLWDEEIAVLRAMLREAE